MILKNGYTIPYTAGNATPYNLLKLEKNDNGDLYFKSSNWGKIALSDCMKMEG